MTLWQQKSEKRLVETSSRRELEERKQQEQRSVICVHRWQLLDNKLERLQAMD